MKKHIHIVIYMTVLVILTSSLAANANTIALQNATATYTQVYPPQPQLWSAGKTIDGVTEK